MIQNEPFITDDLAPYRGLWVAVRDGKVYENDLDATALSLKPGVLPTDDLIFVPMNQESTFLL